MGITYTGQAGYISAQPKVGTGIVDSVFAGENAIHEPNGWRAFNGWGAADSARALPTMAYTATLTVGVNVVVLSGGATAKTDFRFAQHILLGRKLFVIEKIIADDRLQVSPAPDANSVGVAIKKVPALSALNLDRATLLAGNAVRFREQAIFAIGDGDLYVNGAAISATLTASEALKVAYPIPAGGFDSRLAGFTTPPAPTVVEGTAGTKNLPTGAYWVAVSRKRKGFSGQGNPSDRSLVTITVAGNRIKVSLGAFDATQGQTAWNVYVSRISERATERPGLWLFQEYDVQSTDVEFDFFDDDLVERAEYDNDPPPKALFVFTLGNHLAIASCGGPPDGTGANTTPGAEVAASKYNNPEAFSPFAHTPTEGGEVIAGVALGELVAYLMTPNSLQVVSLTGNSINPFAIRKQWGAGFAHQYCGVVHNDLFYGLTKRGLFRTIGKDADQATDDFARAVRPELQAIAPGRSFIGSDIGKKQVVVFWSNARQGAGGGWQTKAMVYNTEQGAWSAPAWLGDGTTDFIVTSCATIGNDLYVTTADGAVWRWDDEASGLTIAGFLGFPFVAGDSRFLKTVRSSKLTGNANGELRIYTQLDQVGLVNGAAAPAFALPGGGTGQSIEHPEWGMNTLCNSFAMRLSFSLPAGAPVFDALEVEYLEHEGFSQ
jgi:hypothetical protein